MTPTSRPVLAHAATTLVLTTAIALLATLTVGPPGGRSGEQPAVRLAAGQGYVVEDYASYQPQVSCDPRAKAGVKATRRLMRNRFGGRDLGITRNCGTGGQSEHKEGRAWDWGLNAHLPRERRIANRGLKWLLATVRGEPAARARRLGISYLIWNRKIWRAYNPSAGWQRYTGSSPHTDHVHFSFGWNGATKRTSYWTGRVHRHDYGPCRRWVGEYAPRWTKPRTAPCPQPLRRPKADNRGVYRAQRGETVNRVARWFHKRPLQIRRWNGWAPRGKVALRPGQQIWTVHPAHQVNRRGIYRALPRDTVNRVARWHGKRPIQIRRWNGWAPRQKVTLRPGQRIRVRR